ncbi:MAG TPA: hypothetical protein VFO40_21025 [Chthoniobacterales bacterium]|nr:hypothetical protein [Chthoniobacterales bacterium]
MKRILPAIIAAIGFSCPTFIHAQEQALTNWPTQDGQNFQVGQLACPLSVQGLNIRDSSGNLTNSIPLLTDPASVQATTQIGDTLYALIPPDGTNQATAAIMYQAASSTSDEVNKAVQDALNHNNWFDTTFVVRNINQSGELLPAGTEFWVCSSTGFVTFTDSGAISVAGPPAPVADASDPGIASLLSLTNSATATP